MAKTHPLEEELEQQENSRVDDSPRLAEFVQQVLQKVRKDEEDRGWWISAKIEAYDRRYAASMWDKPDVLWPWPGASSFNLGLSDTHIEEMKPSLLNLVFGAKRVYEMMPMNGAAFPQAFAANLAMDSLLKYRMPDYLHQICYGIDSLGTYGLKVDKVFYSYVTRLETVTLRKAELPQPLSMMAVFDELGDAQRQMAAMLGVRLMTKEQFDAAKAQIERSVIQGFDLDKDEKEDRLALASVMRFLRNGSQGSHVSFKRRRVVEDTPRLVNVPIPNIVCPQGTRTIAEASRICEWLPMTETDLRERARDLVWNDKAVSAVLAAGPTAPTASNASGELLRRAQLERARSLPAVAQGGRETFRIAQICCYYDIDHDGNDERCVLTLEPNSGAILKAIPWDGEWPYTDTLLEATEQDRSASRGIPEQICDLERHGSALLRGEENGLIIETAPMFKYRDTSDFDPMTTPMMPGMMVPVSDMDAFERIDMGPLKSLALEGPLRNMLQLAERRISGSNRAVLDLPPPERRTKAEVESFENARTRVLTVRAMLFQEGQKRNGKLIWDLWRRFGPDKFWSFVTGQPPLRQSQMDITGDYSVCPVAAAGDLDPGYRAQKAFARLQMLAQVAPMLQGDLRYAPDLAEAVNMWLEEDDPLAAQRLMHQISPQEQQALMAQQQQTAQRSALIADIAERWQMNAPVSPEEGKILLTEIHKVAPHKDLQQIGDFNKVVQGMLRQQQLLAGSGAGQAA